MKTTAIAIICALSLLCFGEARTEPYVDYTPQKGVWHVTTLKVDSNHIDDYLTGLKTTWIPFEAVARKHGVIDSYRVMVKLNPADGQGNVLLIEHIPDLALKEPDQARDQAMAREVYVEVAKAKSDAKTADFNRYRVFVGDDYWSEQAYPK
jgi:hypothetical protein